MIKDAGIKVELEDPGGPFQPYQFVVIRCCAKGFGLGKDLSV